MRTATWQQIEEFCRKDGWEHIRDTKHSFYRKVLADGTVLETHLSFASDKTTSRGRFAAILRTQLKVSHDEFWETLRSGEPAPRPRALAPESAATHPSWVVDALKWQFGKSEQEIAEMGSQEAERYVRQRWSAGEGE